MTDPEAKAQRLLNKINHATYKASRAELRRASKIGRKQGVAQAKAAKAGQPGGSAVIR